VVDIPARVVHRNDDADLDHVVTSRVARGCDDRWNCRAAGARYSTIRRSGSASGAPIKTRNYSADRHMNHPKHALLAILLLVVLAAIPAPARAEWTSACVPGTAAPLCHFWKGKLKWVDDGDTIDVKLANRKRYRSTVRVRIAGIQAMEQYVYTSHPRERRGECHAVQATARLEQLIKQGHGIVHLAAQDPTSLSGTRRLRRSVSVKLHGAWRDVGEILVAEGHALWLPSTVEWAWNTTFSTLSQQAATRGVNLWDSDVCGVGPSEGAALRVKVHPNAKGNDFDNVNGERVKIENLDPVNPAPLGGWWLRDST